MRNRYPGTCYRCGTTVATGAGHFERHKGGWRTQHADCAIKAREEKERRELEECQKRLSARAEIEGRSPIDD